MFNTQHFEKALTTSWLGHNYFFFEELGSTNTYAKKMSRVDTLHGVLVLADSQTQGRGQYDRYWEAAPGENLTFSLVFEPQNASRLTVLALACALAVAQICSEEVQPEKALLKWPNDILVGGHKVGGVLTEAIFNGSVLERVIIGMGVNVNQASFSDKISGSTTSLSVTAQKKYSRERLLAHILTKIEYHYRLWANRDINLLKAINKSMIGYGLWTRLHVNGLQREGEYKFLGVNENGALVVLNKDLEVDTFSYEQVRISID